MKPCTPAEAAVQQPSECSLFLLILVKGVNEITRTRGRAHTHTHPFVAAALRCRRWFLTNTAASSLSIIDGTLIPTASLL